MTLPNPEAIIKAVDVFCVDCTKKSCQIKDLARSGQNKYASWIEINGVIQCKRFKKAKIEKEKSVFDILEG